MKTIFIITNGELNFCATFDRADAEEMILALTDEACYEHSCMVTQYYEDSLEEYFKECRNWYEDSSFKEEGMSFETYHRIMLCKWDIVEIPII